MNLQVNDSPPEEDAERFSALIDGECTAVEAAQFTRRWEANEQLQAQWHLHHLIGDTLRSDDLASPRRNDDFMRQLRARLAQEPAIVAPGPLPIARQRARWLRPMSAAAGVMAVAGSVWLLPVRQTTPTSQSMALASRPTAVTTMSVTLPTAGVASEQRLDRSRQELDRLLSAHQQFQSATAVAPLAGYLRPADYETTGR